MVSKMPKDAVKAKWGTKHAAADAIIAIIGDPDGKTRQRIKHASNSQLLRMYDNALLLQKKFTTRAALESEILKHKFPKGAADETYKAKLESFGIGRLLDMHRQLSSKAA